MCILHVRAHAAFIQNIDYYALFFALASRHCIPFAMQISCIHWYPLACLSTSVSIINSIGLMINDNCHCRQ